MTRRIIAFLLALTLIFVITTPVFAATSDNGNTIVYRTRTGERYHRDGCSYLRSSCIELTLREAVERGLRPCSRCSPPRYNGEISNESSAVAPRNNGDSSGGSSTNVNTNSSKSDQTSSSSNTNSKTSSGLSTDTKSVVSSKESKEQRKRAIKLWSAGIIGGVVLVAAAGLFTKNAISKKRAEEERRKKEAQFLAEKQAFLARLNGRNIRDVAGVPNQLKLVNGLPIDNNDAEFGSYTVYRSLSGRCYHDKKGCCSASFPIHYFEARPWLTPCSKCCVKQREIPQWFFEYRSLKKQAEKYHIDYTEYCEAFQTKIEETQNRMPASGGNHYGGIH